MRVTARGCCVTRTAQFAHTEQTRQFPGCPLARRCLHTCNNLSPPQGPREDPFLTPMSFHQCEVLALSWGDEAAALLPRTGYRGELTIAMRSTKARLGGQVAAAACCRVCLPCMAAAVRHACQCNCLPWRCRTRPHDASGASGAAQTHDRPLAVGPHLPCSLPKRHRHSHCRRSTWTWCLRRLTCPTRARPRSSARWARPAGLTRAWRR